MIARKYPYQVTLYPENCSGQGSAATPDKHKTAEVIDRWALFPTAAILEGEDLGAAALPFRARKMALKQATTDQLDSNSDYYLDGWALTSVDPKSDIAIPDASRLGGSAIQEQRFR